MALRKLRPKPRTDGIALQKHNTRTRKSDCLDAKTSLENGVLLLPDGTLLSMLGKQATKGGKTKAETKTEIGQRQNLL